MHFPPEFRLVAACCRWPPSAARDSAVRSAAAEPVDWALFPKVVARHRVEGLVHDALSAAETAVPRDVASDLAAAAAGIARQNLAFAAAARKLSVALEARGLAFRLVKGVALNRLAYGTLAVKRASDVDVVLDPADYAGAVRMLIEEGAHCLAPRPDADFDAVMAWTRRNKHSIWRRDGVVVEMHSSLVDNERMLPGVSARSPAQWVELAPGMAVPTLARDELFAYLCVHGATHAWSRLKWLADVAALLSRERPEEVERLYRRAVAFGAGRSAAAALLLAHELLGLPLAPGFAAELHSSRAVRFLMAVARDAMVRGGADAELDESVLGTFGVHLSHFRMARGFGYKLSEARRKLASAGSGADESSWLRLTAPVRAVPLWLWRRMRRAAARIE
ncbi:MAG: hypothetical protein QOJ94_1835 [Sphingomonadales bacterium]|nr:hypothetical protein [Sphingomonadales bacterium]